MNYLVYNISTGVINSGGVTDNELFIDILPPTLSLIVVDNFKDYFDNKGRATHYINNNQIFKYTEQEFNNKYTLIEGFTWDDTIKNLVDNRTLQQTKDQKWQSVKQERSLRENSTFTYNGNLYDADKEHIPGAAQLALLAKSANQPFSINWTLADNSVVTLDADEMIAVGAALGSYINSIYDTARDLRDQINAATTIAEVDSIQWPT